MNMIGCMDKPTKGKILLDGADILRESSKRQACIRRGRIGLIFQPCMGVNGQGFGMVLTPSVK